MAQPPVSGDDSSSESEDQSAAASPWPVQQQMNCQGGLIES